MSPCTGDHCHACGRLGPYKLGLAAFLVVLEFLLARLTRLDMSRFLAWHSANLASYAQGVRTWSHPLAPKSCWLNSPG